MTKFGHFCSNVTSSDIRKDTLVQGRSINMALAKRGMTGLEKIGLLDTGIKTMKIAKSLEVN